MRRRSASGTSLRSLLVAVAVVLALPACGSRRDAERLAEEATAEGKRGPRVGEGPQALMVRFEERRGPILEREGWELEILALGGDARLRGSVRSPATVRPVAGTLTPEEFADLWAELSALPLDGFRVEVDSTVAEAGWIKRLDVDIVLGADRRIRSRNAWTRPPVGAAWLADLESLLLAVATEHVAAEPAAPNRPDSTRDAVDRAVRDAMHDLTAPPPGTDAPPRTAAPPGTDAPPGDAGATP